MANRTLEVSAARDGILYITIQGDVTEANLPGLKEDVARGAAIIRDESEKALRPLPVVVDVSNLNRTYSPEGIMVLAEFEKKNRPYVTKTAVFGADIKIKFTGEIISSLSNRNNISFFETKEEAIASLKSDTPAG